MPLAKVATDFWIRNDRFWQNRREAVIGKDDANGK